MRGVSIIFGNYMDEGQFTNLIKSGEYEKKVTSKDTDYKKVEDKKIKYCWIDFYNKFLSWFLIYDLLLRYDFIKFYDFKIEKSFSLYYWKNNRF